MGDKYRKMERVPWERVSDREFAICDCEEIQGVSGLMHIIDISNPTYRTYSDGIKIAIVENDCFWIQFAPKNEHWWLTAMLKDDGSFSHAYFDMTEYNVINGKKSWFSDLYLDVVIKENGDAFLLDEDELKTALEDEIISNEQYKQAIYTSERIISEYGGKGIEKIVNLCRKYFDVLYPKLNEREEHSMHIEKTHFDKIKSGEKNVELRLNDEKRQKICVGDCINFYCDSGESIKTKVIDLYVSESFEKMFCDFSKILSGFEKNTPQYVSRKMQKYYSYEQRRKYGVLGIKIKLI